MPPLKDKEKKITISPKIVTQGGQVNISFSFTKDPFLYKESDFLIHNTPFKLVYMGDHFFKGEILYPLDPLEHEITVHLNKKEKVIGSIFVPEIIANQFNQLENNVFFDKEGEMVFLDTKKVGDQILPVLCKYNFLNSYVQKATLSNHSINSIFLDQNDILYGSSAKDKTLYTIDENLEITSYVQGLGAPFGMINNKNNELFVADQKGSLFLLEGRKAIFLCDIPSSIKGYYLAVCPENQDIYISTPNYAGKNTLLAYSEKTRQTTLVLHSYNILGAIAFDEYSTLYWVEHTRTESIIYRNYKGKKEKIMSGYFFMGMNFDSYGDFFVNDLHRIYKIDKGLLYDNN